MTISIIDLPPTYQKQVEKKLLEQCAPKNTSKQSATAKTKKYNNEPEMVNGVRFDSRKEARRYQELMLLLTTGEIRDLRLQDTFVLQQAYTTPSGVRIRAITYKADFSYLRPTKPDVSGAVYWLKVVEDVKSVATRTKEYMIKRKMMTDTHGIQISEV